MIWRAFLFGSNLTPLSSVGSFPHWALTVVGSQDNTVCMQISSYNVIKCWFVFVRGPDIIERRMVLANRGVCAANNAKNLHGARLQPSATARSGSSNPHVHSAHVISNWGTGIFDRLNFFFLPRFFCQTLFQTHWSLLHHKLRKTPSSCPSI